MSAAPHVAYAKFSGGPFYKLMLTICEYVIMHVLTVFQMGVSGVSVLRADQQLRNDCSLNWKTTSFLLSDQQLRNDRSLNWKTTSFLLSDQQLRNDRSLNWKTTSFLLSAVHRDQLRMLNTQHHTHLNVQWRDHWRHRRGRCSTAK